MSKINTKLTKNQKIVLETLTKNKSALGVYEILKCLDSDSNITAPLTVYRALDALIEKGLVHRIEKLRAFYACTTHESHHGISSFLICNNCKNVLEISYKIEDTKLNKQASLHGFKINDVYFEGGGICKDCQTTNEV